MCMRNDKIFNEQNDFGIIKFNTFEIYPFVWIYQ